MRKADCEQALEMKVLREQVMHRMGKAEEKVNLLYNDLIATNKRIDSTVHSIKDIEEMHLSDIRLRIHDLEKEVFGTHLAIL